MPVLIRMALRNLFEHKSKSLIIGIIISVGVLILVVGNSLMDTASKGIEKTFINNFTGHIMITGIPEGKISLFGVQTPGQIEKTPVLPDYPKIFDYLSNHPAVESFTSQITGFAMIKIEEKLEADSTLVTMLFGIEPVSYKSVFDNLVIEEGEYLSPDQKGILLSSNTLKRIKEELQVELGPGDKILLSSMGSSGFKIREVPITGIVSFKESTEASDMISYVDAQTLRALKGMTLGGMDQVDLSEEDTALLETEDMFSLFEDSFTIEDTENTSGELEEEDLFNLLALETEESSQPIQIDSGAWEYILLKLKNPRQTKRLLADLSLFFSKNNIEAMPGDWKAAAGPFSTSADVVRIVFNAAVILVAVVAVIIIMNTLVISVIERTGEIGTMRALGGQKGFIRRLFTLEIITITLVFGLLGILAALLILGIVTLIGIKAGNPFVTILFAGPVLRPVINIGSLFLIWFLVIILGILANLYPLRLALRVAPIKAMQTD